MIEDSSRYLKQRVVDAVGIKLKRYCDFAIYFSMHISKQAMINARGKNKSPEGVPIQCTIIVWYSGYGSCEYERPLRFILLNH